MSILNKAAARVRSAVDQVANTALAVQWLEEQSEILSTRGEKLMNGTRNYVAEHPLQSLGFALAAGFLISRLLR